MDNEQAVSAKQQLLEILRNANSIVVTTSGSPGVDQIAAALGLRMLLDKLDKSVEVVTAGPVPDSAKFLPINSIHDKVQGQRDFIVTIDQSRAEADHLKYDIIDGKIKLFVTPFSGKFTEEDVSYSYGDYHCDAIVALGAQSADSIDKAVTSDQELMKNARILLINAGPGSSDQGSLSWADASASSVCEMIMSLSEALGSGLMDEGVATALFTGIVDKTNHFTNASTTPKVMTMAAQLLAAGARQADVVNNLSGNRDQPAPQSDQASGKLPPKQASDDQGGAKQQESQEKNQKESHSELQVRQHKQQLDRGNLPNNDGQKSVQQKSSKGTSGSQTPASNSGSDTSPQKPSPPPVDPSGDRVESVQIPTVPPRPPQTPNAQKPADMPPGVPPVSSNAGASAPTSPYTNSPTQVQNQHERVLQPPGKPQIPQLSGQPNEPSPQPPPGQPEKSGQPGVQPPPFPPTSSQPTPPTPQSGGSDSSSGSIDLEAARRAVEEAAKSSLPPPDPGQQ